MFGFRIKAVPSNQAGNKVGNLWAGGLCLAGLAPALYNPVLGGSSRGQVAELADAPALGVGGETRAGSSPALPTQKRPCLPPLKPLCP